MSRAVEIMKSFGEHALIGTVDGLAIMIEDQLIEVPELMHRSDGQSPYFRIEIQSDPSGKHARAYVRHNPFARPGEGLNAGCSYASCHIATNGHICIGPHASTDDAIRNSPYDLEYVIPRARYLCLAFTAFKLNGSFPQPV